MANGGLHIIWPSPLRRPIATKMRNGIAASMAVCTRGSRRGALADHWDLPGVCRRMKNGGKWRSTTVVSARLRRIRVKRHTRRSWPEAVRDSMLCSAVAALTMASMHDWKLTDSTGRPQSPIQPVDSTSILAEAGKRSIVKAAARSKEHFPCDASGSDDCYSWGCSRVNRR